MYGNLLLASLLLSIVFQLYVKHPLPFVNRKWRVCLLLTHCLCVLPTRRWSSDNSPIRQKMIYASSQEAVLNKMPVQRSIQATDLDDLVYKVIKDGIAK